MNAELDAHQVAAARLWATNKFPYLASGLFALKVVAAEGIDTVAVDEGWGVHADPAVVEEWTVPELGSVLVHHVGHLLREHADRARAKLVGEDESQDWLRAADAEINDDLVHYGLDLPGQAILPRSLDQEDGQLAETYFEHIHAEDVELDLPDCRICGSGADGRTREWDGEDDNGMVPNERDLLRRQIATEIRDHAVNNPGELPGSLERWAEQILVSKVDWRRVLAAEIRRGLADTSGAVDYTYQRLSRRASVAGDVVLPALRRPVPEVAVVCDTSASMSERLLTIALGEVEGILRTVGVGRAGLRVLACDLDVQAVSRVSSARQVELVGGGGTDMGRGIKAASEARPRPAVIVVLTDGYTPWPLQAPRGSRVIVGLLGKDAPEGGPGWARCVYIDE